MVKIGCGDERNREDWDHRRNGKSLQERKRALNLEDDWRVERRVTYTYGIYNCQIVLEMHFEQIKKEHVKSTGRSDFCELIKRIFQFASHRCSPFDNLFIGLRSFQILKFILWYFPTLSKTFLSILEMGSNNGISVASLCFKSATIPYFRHWFFSCIRLS